MYAAGLILTSLLAAAGASPVATAPKALHQRASVNGSTTSVVPATWDGKCFYPASDPKFTLSDYLGTWYQQAATVAPFNLGCECVVAKYALNDDGTVGVVNTCKRLGLTSSITGSASPVDPAYGAVGVFDVQLAGTPPTTILCPGPNYIVQAFEDDWAIVQAPDFTTLFILSRQQVQSDADVDSWMARAESLGSNLALVKKTTQTGC